MTHDTQWPLWEVFVQDDDGSAHVHVGSVHAPDSELALQNARDTYTRRGRFSSIWVVESAAIAATSPDDRPSFFDSAPDKVYRHPQFYKVPRGVKGL